jgi:anaerobic magnesium-protoporphyrin IX monomethyl ester cyclase
MGKKDFSSIPNICFKKGEKIYHTKKEKINVKLDALPYPARHLVDKYEYGYLHGNRLAKGRLTSIITSRGCAYRCNFCNLRVHIPELELRSSEGIIKEIEDISNKGYETLVFVDDNFITRKKVLTDVLDYIKNEKLDLRLWIWEARADAADRSLFEKMRDAGTEAINFGIESGSQEVLDYYDKKLTIQQIENAVSLSREMFLLVTGTFIIGSPIETKEHIKKTIKFSSSLPLDSAIFYRFQYTYKSKFWEDAVKEGKIKPDEFRVVPDVRRGLGNFTTEEIKRFARIAYMNFFMNPSRWMRTLKSAIKYNDTRIFFQGMQMVKQITTEKSGEF